MLLQVVVVMLCVRIAHVRLRPELDHCLSDSVRHRGLHSLSITRILFHSPLCQRLPRTVSYGDNDRDVIMETLHRLSNLEPLGSRGINNTKINNHLVNS